MSLPYGFRVTWVGVLFLALLLAPNLLSARRLPANHGEFKESRVLQALERIGQVVLVTGLLCWPFPSPAMELWSLWLAAALVLMALYEAWWVKYFHGPATEARLCSGLLGIPLAGATLPVAAFLLLGAYGRSLALILAALVFGAGHIGVHWQHYLSVRSKM